MEAFQKKQPANDEDTKPDTRKDLRETVNLILPDSLMVALAVVMIPAVVIPLFMDLPDSLYMTFKVADYAILVVFIVEYLSKLILAPDILKHFVSPWHLLDLLIVVVPLTSFLPFVSSRLLGSSPMLRLLRIIRVLAVGGRTLDRRFQLTTPTPAQTAAKAPLSIQIMDGKLTTNHENVPIDQLKKYLDNPAHTWADISSISESDLDQISTILGIPKIILESELTEESYPRADYYEHYLMIFVRLADIQVSRKDRSLPLSVSRTGLLVICHGQNIITISQTRTDLFHQIIENAKQIHSADDPIVITILYTILRNVLERDRKLITSLEQELMALESIPLRKLPDDFLETTFRLRKEINPLVPSILHLKEILSVITSKRVPLEGFGERHEEIFDILADEATYLHETASNARDTLQSLVDLYINTTSFQTNRVMRVIAVITSLGIIPAVLGLLGSNIMGTPWDIQLWQAFFVLGLLMLAMGWIFYRLGWLKG